MKKIKRKQDEDRESIIRQFFENYLSDMYKVAKTRLYNDEDIYDAIQETGYKLCKNIYKIKEIEKIKTWTIKVLINECNRIYRVKKKEIELQEKMYKKRLEMINTNCTNMIDLEYIIDSLSKEDKNIITLYYANHFTTKEIAKILRKNESTIRSKLKRAKDHIKNNYNKEEDE